MEQLTAKEIDFLLSFEEESNENFKENISTFIKEWYFTGTAAARKLLAETVVNYPVKCSSIISVSISVKKHALANHIGVSETCRMFGKAASFGVSHDEFIDRFKRTYPK